MDDQMEQEARIRRLLLVGVLASFLAFFGAVAAEGYVNMLDDDGSSAIVRIVGDGDDDDRTANVPRTRTRSS